MKQVLVVGGAGYVGSEVCCRLFEAGLSPIVLDNFSNGHESNIKWGPYVAGDIRQTDDIRQVFKRYKIDAVVHCGALAYVGESVLRPREYYENNVLGSFNLLSAMVEHQVGKIIFSSTCSIYGDEEFDVITEDTKAAPCNPYAETKHAVENMLHAFDGAYGIKYITLRFFNVGGASSREFGENHSPETHVIPLLINAAIKRIPFEVFGIDYDTADGTCIRDYVHVTDIADGHIAALNYLKRSLSSDVFNLGAGRGVSVMELIDVVEAETQNNIRIVKSERRAGDPSSLIASNLKAKTFLNWTPERSGIENIVKSALNWHLSEKNPRRIIP